MKTIFLDFETNGDNSNHRIIQTSYILIKDGSMNVFDEIIHQDTLDPFITNLTKITYSDLDEGISESELASHFNDLLDEDTIIVSHNCQFELSKLFDLLYRYYGYNDAYNILSRCQYLDTLTIMRDRKSYVYNKSTHSLKDCIEHYKLTDVQYHNSLYDVLALYKLFVAIIEEKDDVNHYLNLFGYHPEYPVISKFNFINYKEQYYINRIDVDTVPKELYRRE
ncbi:MAG: 3'-5' exonuclease [Bacilli bacterium]|nr:3'-5' exonuclease [Bacilli bacterium]